MRNVLGAVKVGLTGAGERIPIIEHEVSDDALRSLWSRLPKHPALLEAIGITDRGVLLGYAAVRDVYRSDALSTLGHLGAALAAVYRTLVRGVPAAELGRLLEPFVVVDVAHQLRVGFRPCAMWSSRLAHELERSWPRCSEAAVAYAIGTAITDHVVGSEPRELSEVLERCRTRNVKRRYSLGEAQRHFATSPGCRRPPRHTTRMRGSRSKERSAGSRSENRALRSHASITCSETPRTTRSCAPCSTSRTERSRGRPSGRAWSRTSGALKRAAI